MASLFWWEVFCWIVFQVIRIIHGIPSFLYVSFIYQINRTAPDCNWIPSADNAPHDKKQFSLFFRRSVYTEQMTSINRNTSVLLFRKLKTSPGKMPEDVSFRQMICFFLKISLIAMIRLQIYCLDTPTLSAISERVMSLSAYSKT